MRDQLINNLVEKMGGLFNFRKEDFESIIPNDEIISFYTPVQNISTKSALIYYILTKRYFIEATFNNEQITLEQHVLDIEKIEKSYTVTRLLKVELENPIITLKIKNTEPISIVAPNKLFGENDTLNYKHFFDAVSQL